MNKSIYKPIYSSLLILALLGAAPASFAEAAQATKSPPKKTPAKTDPRLIRPGSTTNNPHSVEKLQGYLVKLELLPEGKPEGKYEKGKYDQTTQDAVKKFQKDTMKVTTPDGKVGTNTWGALEAEVEKKDEKLKDEREKEEKAKKTEFEQLKVENEKLKKERDEKTASPQSQDCPNCSNTSSAEAGKETAPSILTQSVRSEDSPDEILRKLSLIESQINEAQNLRELKASRALLAELAGSVKRMNTDEQTKSQLLLSISSNFDAILSANDKIASQSRKECGRKKDQGRVFYGSAICESESAFADFISDTHRTISKLPGLDSESRRLERKLANDYKPGGMPRVDFLSKLNPAHDEVVDALNGAQDDLRELQMEAQYSCFRLTPETFSDCNRARAEFTESLRGYQNLAQRYSTLQSMNASLAQPGAQFGGMNPQFPGQNMMFQQANPGFMQMQTQNPFPFMQSQYPQYPFANPNAGPMILPLGVNSAWGAQNSTQFGAPMGSPYAPRMNEPFMAYGNNGSFNTGSPAAIPLNSNLYFGS